MTTSNEQPKPELLRLADEYGVEPAAALAVAEVEANGSGYDESGLLKVLYEPHIAHRLTHDRVKRANLMAAGLAASRWGKIPYARTNEENWDRIREAAKIVGKEKALQFASYGKFQIMGFNYQRAGYKSATDMVNDFLNSDDAQVRAFFRFVSSDERMLNALRKKNFTEFARRYNGPGYKRNRYDRKLARAYKRYSRGFYNYDKNVVRRIQMYLLKNGWTISVDGLLGPQTSAAIKDFIKGNEIDITYPVDLKWFVSTYMSGDITESEGDN